MRLQVALVHWLARYLIPAVTMVLFVGVYGISGLSFDLMVPFGLSCVR